MHGTTGRFGGLGRDSGDGDLEKLGSGGLLMHSRGLALSHPEGEVGVVHMLPCSSSTSGGMDEAEAGRESELKYISRKFSGTG